VTLYVGTAGWLHHDWRGLLYPHDLPPDEWSARYADRFAAIEVVAERAAPAGVVVSRVSTDVPHLRIPGDGPLLLRLTSAVPPHLHLLQQVLDDIPSTIRVAVELVGAEWARPEIERELASHNAATCWSDRHSRPLGPRWRTADWYYLRFHGGSAVTVDQSYGRRALLNSVESLAAAFGASADGYAFFANVARGAALMDTVHFAALAEEAGLTPTRVPDREEVGLNPLVW
jgi:uncharacterized protein YecE (DUF72 family)